jgi:hypothetical protein
MVSGFLTSPKDHSLIFSGEAKEILTALKLDGSFGFVKKLYNSSNAYLLYIIDWRLIIADFQSVIDNRQYSIPKSGYPQRAEFPAQDSAVLS